ncbi:MAG: cytochrome c3 family protein [Bacteroidota bacterium]
MNPSQEQKFGRLPYFVYNPITITGAAISLVSFGTILFVFITELIAETPKAYLGLIAYVLLPGVLFIGLFFVVLGIIIERRRRKKLAPTVERYPRIDLNDPRHRALFTLFSVSTLTLLLFTGIGSFKAYEYTDSAEFCGQLCHEVMEPEFIAYQHSPHARVRCVDCHVGPGAGWFVRSKLSGAYQVYAVLFNRYPRPIPTPITNLRPAQETCEQCHWPQQFFSEKKVVKTYFRKDEENTPWTVTLLMKIGGGHQETGPTTGIHWHMNIAHKITYVAADSQKQVIPWVRSEDYQGNAVEYVSTEYPLSEQEIAESKKYRMDCMDCHNRPTHVFYPPDELVNLWLALGRIDPKLPYVKSTVVEALAQPYSSRQVAVDSVEIIIREFYDTEYSDLSQTSARAIENAVEETRKTYSRNFFPSMGVSWRKYPNNVGHLYDIGCFRCHDGNHVSPDGKVLSRDCNTCHTILAQGEGLNPTEVSLEGLPFEHPEDIGGAWMEMNCSDCHTGE